MDSGIILSLEHTKVFSADTICTLARRHYELEIEMLANVLDVLSKRVKSPQGRAGNNAHEFGS